jgi:hypothetical protein
VEEYLVAKEALSWAAGTISVSKELRRRGVFGVL